MNTHDYTRRRWEHDYTFRPVDGGVKGDATGWGGGLKQGDYLLLQNKSGSTRYRIQRLRYFTDPPDMWRAHLEFAPR